MRPLGALVFAVAAGGAAWLAVANRDTAIVSLNALAPGDPASSAALPVYAILFAGIAIGLIAGAGYMLVSQARLHRRLREAEARAGRLQHLLGEEVSGRGTLPAAPPARISD